MVFETVEISTPAEESSAVSWPAIAAGAIAAAALTLVLLAFGAGMGFSAVSPWGNSGISASTFQITTGTKSSSATQLMAFWHGHSPR